MMGQTHDEITQNLAERLCWEVACRDDARVARRLYRKQEVDGVYRLDEGAVLDDFFHFLQVIGVMTLLEEVHGTKPRHNPRYKFGELSRPSAFSGGAPDHQVSNHS
jgi:hypothetical protein